MEKLEASSLAEPPKALKDAIDLLVKVYGASIRLPVGYIHFTEGVATPDRLERAFPGTLITIDLRARYFTARVQEARLKSGMPKHAYIQDHVTFEPEPRHG